MAPSTRERGSRSRSGPRAGRSGPRSRFESRAYQQRSEPEFFPTHGSDILGSARREAQTQAAESRAREAAARAATAEERLARTRAERVHAARLRAAQTRRASAAPRSKVADARPGRPRGEIRGASKDPIERTLSWTNRQIGSVLSRQGSRRLLITEAVIAAILVTIRELVSTEEAPVFSNYLAVGFVFFGLGVLAEFTEGERFAVAFGGLVVLTMTLANGRYIIEGLNVLTGGVSGPPPAPSTPQVTAMPRAGRPSLTTTG